MRATRYISLMSASICGRISGRITFSTTSRPLLLSLAVCTWAIDAEANGLISKSSNQVSSGAPSSSSINCLACRPSNGATLSCNIAKGSAMCGGNRSRRVDIICPNLIHTGPSSCSAKRKRSPNALSAC
ncbi:Uncharacterised protein [Vibrio cholerae]|nr:Uncharacterised protein [Vibrio cholerae]